MRNKNYTLKELRVIAKAINLLANNSNYTLGVVMNSHHIGRFYNKAYYIDYNERLKCCKVYKKTKGWKRPTERLNTP